MGIRFAEWISGIFNIDPERAGQVVQRVLVVIAAILFALTSTVIVAFDDIFIGFNDVANLVIGSVPSNDIIARNDATFVSEILTAQEQENARNLVPAVYDPPDPEVARQQTQLTQQILEFIDNVRSDPYADIEQKIVDIRQINALTLDEETSRSLLQLTDDSWSVVRSEIVTVLERVMRQSIRQSQLQSVLDQLPTQVSVRLKTQESIITTAITSDMIRPNTFENPEKTLETQNAAADAVEPQQRSYLFGQIVASANQPIDDLTFEALQKLGLLSQSENQNLSILRALVASTLVMVLTGLYINRFEPQLFYSESSQVALIAVLFLLALFAARIIGPNENLYLFPAATLGILYVAITNANLAIIGTVGFAFLGGLMGQNSLETAVYIGAGNLTAILTLRNAGRLNSFFVTGTIVGVTNVAVVTIFNLLTTVDTVDLTSLFAALVSGIVIVPTISFAGMYAMTIVLNLPTPFKLIDLSQPSKPLLQRLLREAPGTYQHSLQVANLAEQAAEAIGADAQMTHVGALYHDIGKIANPVFYTENQQHVENPHDTLNDPYRSADIIINHAVEGDAMAKKYNLPNRIREFIREPHGTTQVYVFYKRAVDRAGSADAVDIQEFTYPGPIPQTKETAILMMADSCESAIRAIKPQSNKEIADVVHRIIEGKRNDGQLDACDLTLTELKKIEETFIDIFKGLFHPRIDYDKAVKQPKREPVKPAQTADVVTNTDTTTQADAASTEQTQAVVNGDDDHAENTVDATTKDADVLVDMADNGEPLSEVPPLPKRNGKKNLDQPSLTETGETHKDE
jgi:putative nucleotidyltransferase with HDIG domain